MGCGPDMPAGTNTIFFIDQKLKPTHKKAAYIRIITTERLYKKETKRFRWILGGITYNTNAT